MSFRWCYLAGFGAPFSYLSFDVGFLCFLSFIGFSLASALSSHVLFLLPSSVHVLSASFPFHGLCAFLSRSLPVRPAALSFFALVAWCLFRLLFFCFLVRCLRPRLLNSSVLFFFSVLSHRSSSLCLSLFLYSPFQSSSSTHLLRSSSQVIPLFRRSAHALFSSSVVLASSLFFLARLRRLSVWLCLPSLFCVSCRTSLSCRFFVFSFSSHFISPSSAFLEWFCLRFRFLFLYPSISFHSNFLLAFCLLPAPSSVLSPPCLGVRLRVCARSSVASLLPLPLCFVSGVLPFFPGLVSYLLYFLFLLCVLCFWFSSVPFGVLVSSTGLPGAFPSFAPSFLVRSLPSALYSEVVLPFSFLEVPFPFLFFRSSSGLLLFSLLLACGRCLPKCRVSAGVFCLLFAFFSSV